MRFLPRMLFKQLTLVGAFFAGALAFPAFAQLDGAVEAAADAASNLDIQSDYTTFDENLGIATARGNVVIKYGTTVIEADEAEYHQSSGKVIAKGNVTAFKDGGQFHGDEIIYDTESGEMVAVDLRSSMDPIFYEAGRTAITGGDQPLDLENTFITTHDSVNPNFRINSKRMTIFPGEKVVMKGVKLYAGDRPIFWLPYLSQPLDDELGYYFVPGYNSTWGAFLLNQYGFMIGDHTLAQAHLDYRSERGVAGGIELKSERHRGNDNFGRLNLYFANDQDPLTAFNGRTREEGSVDSSRYRINFQHRVYLPGPEKSTLYVDFDINKLSDEFFYQDFFPSEFRTDPRPDNNINVVKRNPWGTVSLLTRMQLNDFFDTDTRKPELAVDVIRTPLGESGFFYNGYTTYGVIDEFVGDTRRADLRSQADLLRRVRSGFLSITDDGIVDATTGETLSSTVYDTAEVDSILDEIERQLDPRGFNRFDTYHEFLYPTTVGGWLSVVPRAGVGYSNYSSIDAPGTSSFDRSIAHAGTDLSFKVSRKNADAFNKALGIDGMMHVVQPYLNYSFVSTDEIGSRFTPIDRITPTTRLRPIDLPLFTAVDSLQDWQIARIGVFNRWITRRNGGSHQWLALNNYFEAYMEDPEFNRDFSNLFNEVQWSPLPWLAASTTAQVPVFGEEMDFTEITSNISFMPTNYFSFSVGHFFLQDHPFFEDSDLYSFGTYTRLSDQWGFSTNHRFESDDGTLEYQQYQIHRDLSSWTASLGAIARDNRDGEDEWGVLMSLTLKAFPKVSVPLDFQPGN
ncbi:MAG: LPS-assembly protein LptD [Verrucomicrobiales bacterium]|nr:LPS-assembly protein LptD [Verrucomicrobiales bacterium]